MHLVIIALPFLQNTNRRYTLPYFSAKYKQAVYPVTNLGSTPVSLSIILLNRPPWMYSLSCLNDVPKLIAQPTADDMDLLLSAMSLNALVSWLLTGPTVGLSNGTSSAQELYLCYRYTVLSIQKTVHRPCMLHTLKLQQRRGMECGLCRPVHRFLVSLPLHNWISKSPMSPMLFGLSRANGRVDFCILSR